MGDDGNGAETPAKCWLCGQALREPSEEQHCAERGPLGNQCLGCFVAVTELEKFLVRARPSRVVMGPWAEAYLRAVLEDPRRFLR